MKRYLIGIFLASSFISISQTSALSAGDILAGSGIVVKQDTEEGYRTGDFVLRQEVVGMAMKLGGQILPDDYSCKGYYVDTTVSSPNSWACRSVEIAADSGLVSRANLYFRPEDKITRAEALAILMNASKINTGTYSTLNSFKDVTVPWQINISDKALKLGLIDSGGIFGPNADATRGEIFEIAKRILLLDKTDISLGLDNIFQEKPPAPEIKSESDINFQEILDILGIEPEAL